LVGDPAPVLGCGDHHHALAGAQPRAHELGDDLVQEIVALVELHRVVVVPRGGVRLARIRIGMHYRERWAAHVPRPRPQVPPNLCAVTGNRSSVPVTGSSFQEAYWAASASGAMLLAPDMQVPTAWHTIETSSTTWVSRAWIDGLGFCCCSASQRS